ncbi:hypothetical protein Lalb_Chr19g0136771 [Lupinus albus]|uniref:Uncharacterized protein n=1 Tax=Lupinus albus TaxID=3870 RepID=A0A6A4NR04_LUPAL|nr:hypothetical protein Lalb_Chr19g0136771 [Lupinus albus]
MPGTNKTSTILAFDPLSLWINTSLVPSTFKCYHLQTSPCSFCLGQSSQTNPCCLSYGWCPGLQQALDTNLLENQRKRRENSMNNAVFSY